MTTTREGITYACRTVYERGKRRQVWDAVSEDRRFEATAETRDAAIDAVRADMGFCSQWEISALRFGGCELFPMALNTWCFRMRCDQPARSCSYTFQESTLRGAYERIAREYAEHPDCQAFFAAAEALKAS